MPSPYFPVAQFPHKNIFKKFLHRQECPGIVHSIAANNSAKFLSNTN